MVNPFGDEADSVFAWKERYKQADYERNLLKQRVSEIKDEVEQIKREYDAVANQNQSLLSQVDSLKEELFSLKESNINKDKEIDDLSRALDQSSLDKLSAENSLLKDRLEEYQTKQARGDPIDEEEEVSAGIMASLIPVLMREYDPENKRYQDAFSNLVDAVISEGGTIEKTIGYLLKNGGSQQRNALERSVSEPNEFGVAIDILKEEKLVKEVQDTIYLINLQEAPALSDNWENLELSEIFEMMKKVIKDESPKVVVNSITKFRDALTEKQVPMTTMMFQIRKLSEGIEKDQISRAEALEQVEEWENKVLNS